MTDQEYADYVKAVSKGHDFRRCGMGEFFDGEPHDAASCAAMKKRTEGIER